MTVVMRKAGAPASGKVIDHVGKPVVGAEVKVRWVLSPPRRVVTVGQGSSYPKEVTTTYSDKKGLFVFPQFSPEDRLELDISKEGYSKVTRDGHFPGDGEIIILISPENHNQK